MIGLVDVREVAEAHVKALEIPDAAGKRFITDAQDMWMPEMGKILHDEFAPQGYKFCCKEPPFCAIKVAAVFSKDAAFVLPVYGKEFYYDNTRSKELLGINYRPVKESLTEMVNQMIEKGWIPDKRKIE